MALLTLSTQLELSSSFFHAGFTPPNTLNHGGGTEAAAFSLRTTYSARRCNSLKKGARSPVVYASPSEDSTGKIITEEEASDIGVRAALFMLKFYKGEISPLLPSSCRYVPTCSLYSMEAYKRYGVMKGTILTAWRLCRCNPLGGHGFDPPRWFGEEKLSDEC